jgi:hypothetical protein
MNPAAAFWHQLATQWRRRINFAWWWEKWTPGLIAISGLIGLFFLLRRSAGHALPTVAILASAIAALILLSAGLAWAWSRRRFITQMQALVAVEDKYTLNNALSTAEAGQSEWPKPVADLTTRRPEWRWSWLLGPPAVAAALIALGLTWPMRASTLTPTPTSQPLSWNEMETWLDQLQENQVADPEKIQEYRQEIEEFRQQPQKEWFGHQSLEASDRMHQELGQNIDTLGQNLQQTKESLTTLSEQDQELSAAAKEQLQQQFSEAQKQLENLSLKLDPKLMDQLKQIDPSQIKKLSSAQMDQLKKSMDEKLNGMPNAQKQGLSQNLKEMTKEEMEKRKEGA